MMKRFLAAVATLALVVPLAFGDDYVKITSVEELTAGDYVVTGAGTGGEFAMLNVQAGTAAKPYITNLAEAVTIVDSTISNPAASIVWTLEENATLGGWTIYNADGGYVTFKSGGNYSILSNAASAAGAWTFSYDNGFSVQNVSDTTRFLRYNKTSPRFACYTSGQTMLNFYKKSGAAEPSVTLAVSPSGTIEVGDEATVTATATGFDGEVAYTWTGTDGGEGDGAVYTLDTSVAGTFTISVEATDGTSTDTDSIEVTVSEPVQKYAITYAECVNGSVSGPAEAAEGETVSVTATPATGYKLDKVSVDRDPISGTSFSMPAQAVTVSATFEEKPASTGFTLVTEGPLGEGTYVITADRNGTEYGMCAEDQGGSTKRLLAATTDIAIDGTTLTTSDNRIIWTLVADGDNFKLYNEANNVYVYWTSANSASLGAADKAGSYSASVADGVWSFALVSEPKRIIALNATTGNDFFAHYTGSGKKLHLWSGSTAPAALSVSIDQPALSVQVGTAASLTATARGGTAPYTYAWSGDLTGDAATLAIPDTLDAGTYNVTVTVTDAESATATATAVITVAAAHSISIQNNIENGSLTADKATAVAGETVTFTATPASGYKLGAITVTPVGGAPVQLEGNTYVMQDADISATATFVQRTGVSYTLITSMEEVEEGDYIITSTAAERAMTSTLTGGSTKYLDPSEALDVVDDTILSDDETIVWHIAASDSSWTIYNAGIAAYVSANGAANAVKLTTNAVTWTITASETEGAFRVASDDVEGRYLQYNKSSPRFACYTGGQSDLKLYKAGAKGASIAGPATLAGYVGEEMTATFEAKNLEEGVTVTGWTAQSAGSDVGTIANGVWTWANPTAGDFTLTVTAELSDETSLTKEVAVSVKQLWSVTVQASGCTALADPTQAVAGTQVTVSFEPLQYYEFGSLTVNGQPMVPTDNKVTFTMPNGDVTVVVTCEPSGDAAVLTCSEGTTVNATVGQELVLHFTLVNGVMVEEDDSYLSEKNGSGGDFTDITTSSFTYTWTPEDTSITALDFEVLDEDYEIIIESYIVTLNFEGGDEPTPMNIVSFSIDPTTHEVTIEPAGSYTLQYSTNLVDWSETPVSGSAPVGYIRIGAPPTNN